jgi:hypothetical protein
MMRTRLGMPPAAAVTSDQDCPWSAEIVSID